MSKKQEVTKPSADDESFLTADVEPSFVEAVQKELDTKAELEASRLKLQALTRDPEDVRRDEQIAAVEQQIRDEQEAKAAAEKQVREVTLKVDAHRRKLDVLITDLDTLKARYRNAQAENVKYIESQIRLQAETAMRERAKRDIALQMGLITPQQAANAGLSQVDIDTAARVVAARKAALRRG